MTEIAIGQVVEIIENGKFLTAACLDKKNGRYHFITNQGKEINLSPSRFIHISPHKLPVTSKTNLIKELQDISILRENIKNNINLLELWEILKDEAGTYAPKELAELLYPDECSPNHEAALIRAVIDDSIYFKFKENSIIVQDPETVNKILEKRNLELKEQRQLEKAIKWTKLVLESNDYDPQKDELIKDEDLTEFIEKLKDFTLYNEESKHAKVVKNFLKNFNQHPQFTLNLLIKAKIWDEDINLDLIKEDISTTFSKNIQNEVNQIISSYTINFSNREDLTSLYTFTVDGEETKDHDDAISFERYGNNYIIGIHITDFSHYISERSHLFKHIINRATSIYLPDITINMLPEELCHNFWSLKAEQKKEALSFIVEINEDAQIIDYKIFPSVIEVKKRFTYTEFDELIQNNNEYKKLHELCLRLQDERIKEGALPLPIPELNIRVENNTISINLLPITPARFIVAECMVLANNVGARFLKEKNIPAIYKSQPEPRERIIKNITYDIKLNYQQRRLLSRGIMDTEPDYHSGLGLYAYTTLTSPLRRALDFLMQKQLSHYFNYQKPLFSKEELSNFLIHMQEGLLVASQLTQNRVRYFLLKYLSSKINTTFDAWILEQTPNKVLAVLEDYLITVELPKTDTKFSFGDPVKIVLKKAIPRENILKFDWN